LIAEAEKRSPGRCLSALPLAISGDPELGDHHGPIELAHRAEDLTPQPRGRRVVDERVWAVGRDWRDAEDLQSRVADLL
jgi:hypothetical protein